MVTELLILRPLLKDRGCITKTKLDARQSLTVARPAIPLAAC